MYDAELLGPESPGFFCAWESGISPRIIMWSVGKSSEEGLTWSEPQSFTSDSYADFGIALITDVNNQPILLWLQRDTSVEDDTDLYYQLADLEGIYFNPVERNRTPGVARSQRSVKDCATFKWPPGVYTGDISIPDWVPILGGDYGISAYGQICNEVSGCDKSGSGEIGIEAKAGIASASGKGNLTSSWKTDKKNCVYIFDRATLDLGISGQISYPFYKISLPLLGKIEAAIYGSAGANGTLIWKSNFPSWPDDGHTTGTLALGLNGEILLLTGFAGGKATGEASATWEQLHNPPSTKFKEWCVTLTGTLQIGWGGMSRVWTQKFGPCAAGTDTGSRRASYRESMVQKNYRSSKDDVPIFEEMETIKEILTGTGEIYEGNPILGDISTDFYNDGIPAVAKSSTGEIVVVWTKDFPASDLGSKVYAATYQNSFWATPVEITPDIDFNKDTIVMFDSDDNLMVAWSGASNEGLDYEQSSVEEILNAQEKADIFYARRLNGTWNQPRKLADLPGRDEMVSIASGGDGRITAVWLNRTEDEVRHYSSVWNGSDWSVPAEIANAVLMDKPAVTYTSGYLVAVWSQDTDGDMDTFNDWKLLSSAWDGSAWSSPEVLNFPESATTSETDENEERKSARISSRQSSSDRPPEECCCEEGDESEECKEDDDDELDPPDPPADSMDNSSAEVLVSVDPNEKIAPPGTGEKHYVNPGDRLKYLVYFENKSDAAVPAQEVFIDDTLPTSLDWTTLRVEEFSFSDVIVTNPKDSFAFNTRVTIPDYRTEETKQWWVDMSSEFDGASGKLKFVFRTLDPETEDLPEDVFAGLLPPEDGTGRGQGYVSFSVTAKENLAPGTLIENQASIVFDTNDPIVTNQAFNTIFKPDALTTTTVPSTTTTTTSVPTTTTTVPNTTTTTIVPPAADANSNSGDDGDTNCFISTAAGE